MKNSTFLKTAVSALAALFLSSAVSAADLDTTQYSFHGERQAKKICKAVVKDDAVHLAKLLKREKLRILSLKPIDHKYACNSMDLYTFAINVNAVDSQKYLISLDKNRGFYTPQPRVYVEEVAAR